jgi:hypothetical protein
MFTGASSDIPEKCQSEFQIDTTQKRQKNTEN